MTLSRRKILIFGGAAAAVTVAGGWASLATPSLSRAAAPWFAAGQDFADPRLNALSYAILAPNPHNRQPWQFALVGEHVIDVRIDLAKRLPHTDPYDRQITIGFGCMIELLRQAAAELGYTARIDPFPDGECHPRLDDGRIARVRFLANEPARDPLFKAVPERRSTKEPFLERDVTVAQFEALADVVAAPVTFGHTRNPQETAAISANAWQAWKIEYETDATRRESIDLMRIGNDAIVASPDGIDLGGAMMSGLNAVGIITPETLDTPGTTAWQTGYDMYEAMIGSTRHWAWLLSPGESRAELLEVGAAYVRMNLAAQAEGLALHPWSQALQEFPEMAGTYEAMRRLVAPGGETVQMLARVGHGPAVPASPRWPLEAKLVDG